MVKATGASRRGLVVAGLLLALGAASEARANDPWEDPFGFDDAWFGNNTLSHGIVQQRDLDQGGGNDDQDWMIVPTLLGHSYEARLSGGPTTSFDSGACPDCCQFERVDVSGVILTEDVGVVNEGAPEESNDRSVRWIATANTTDEYVRVKGDTTSTEGPESVYTIRFWDTTYSVPRWNNASGQVTVFLIASLVQAPATVNVDFYNAAGVLLTSASTTLQPHALFVLNTATVPQLANSSGHAYVSHTAGYGGLTGKAVALEPATGFSFDTPLQPIPY